MLSIHEGARLPLGTLRRQQGQGAVEFVLIFLLFALLMTGLFEMTRVFRTKHSLNTATFMAVRAGVVNNAMIRPMNAELENNMIDLFMRGERSFEGLGQATARVRAYGRALEAAGGGITIVSPTRQAFNGLRINQRVKRSDEEDYGVHTVIPNDNLRWRPRRSASTNGGSINLQDANLLKIRSLWCHRLVVPLLDRIVYELMNEFRYVHDRQLACNAISEASRAAGEGSPVEPGYYIPVVADATMRMQSPVVSDDLP